jgi:alkylhydroperoxidase family enzyme
MTTTARIPKAEITGVYGALAKRFSKKQFGKVPDPLTVMWHNRRVLKTYLALGGKAENWSACDPNLKTFAHMAVASLVGCTWCLDLGYFHAHNDKLDLDKAREVPRWRESDLFTPLERDVLEYAEAMTQTPPTVTDELSARLLKALGPRRWWSSPATSRWRTCGPAATPPSASSRRDSRRPAACDPSPWRTAVRSTR